MRKKRILAVVAAATLALSMVGCGSGGSSATLLVQPSAI